MPKIVDAEAQRREIQRAAQRVFARRGVAATGLAQVARAAGMGRSSLYHYYPDKASLVRDTVRSLLRDEQALFERVARAEGSARGRIEALAAGLPSLFERWAAVGRMLVELRSSDAALFRPFFRSLRDALASLIAEGQRRGELRRGLDPHLASASVIGAIDGVLLQHVLDRDAFPDRDALFGGLTAFLRAALLP